VADAVVFPDVPVTVNEACPTAAALLAVSVSMVFVWTWPGLRETGFGEIEALTPIGKPEAERVTLPLNPNKLDAEMFAVVVVPIPMVVVV
jgi:hypothetical protein